MLKKVIKSGNSLAVTIPANFVKNTGIKVGDTIKVDMNLSQVSITYSFKGSAQLSLTSHSHLN